jgi:tRNA A-37 threonylcarbamoyl transferase component Bud32
MTAESSKDELDNEMQALIAKIQPPIDFRPQALQALTKLNLPDCGLSSLPDNLGTHLPNLSILFAPKNSFEELPAVIGSCPNLQMISFKSNGMKRIHPEALQPQMRWLILTDNCLEELPKEIGRCSILQKLMLAGNQIHTIPEEISNCTKLELVRLASNQLAEPPMALLNLPNLTWVALSDNPFLAEVVASSVSSTATLPVLEGIDEEGGTILGQGASGTTRQVLWNDKPVAVKTYTGTMTSDGNPQHEKKLALVASGIPSDFLIQVLGQTSDGSLVMELLQNYEALAGPPSMESCSRDVYNQKAASMAPKRALRMLNGLLAVLVQLHEKGICHGDLYGHNILVSSTDRKAAVKLSDFGAAFFYDKTAEYGSLMEQIEMRAFAVLVEEVESIVQAEDFISQDLLFLSKSCRTVATFADLQETWETLQASMHLNESNSELLAGDINAVHGAASGA